MSIQKMIVLLGLLICAATATYASEAINVGAAEEGIWDKTKDVASDVWDGTTEVGSDVWDGTKQVSSDVWEGTKAVGSDIKAGVSDEEDIKTPASTSE